MVAMESRRRWIWVYGESMDSGKVTSELSCEERVRTLRQRKCSRKNCLCKGGNDRGVSNSLRLEYEGCSGNI